MPEGRNVLYTRFQIKNSERGDDCFHRAAVVAALMKINVLRQAK